MTRVNGAEDDGGMVCVRPVVECAIGTNAVGDFAVPLQLAGEQTPSGFSKPVRRIATDD